MGNTNATNSSLLRFVFLQKLRYYMLILAYYKKHNLCINCVQFFVFFVSHLRAIPMKLIHFIIHFFAKIIT